MNFLLISGLLRVLATVAGTVTTGKKAEGISSAMNLAATLIERGAEGEAKLVELKTQLEQMVAGNATLTDADFDALKARSDSAHAAIQNS